MTLHKADVGSKPAEFFGGLKANQFYLVKETERVSEGKGLTLTKIQKK